MGACLFSGSIGSPSLTARVYHSRKWAARIAELLKNGDQTHQRNAGGAYSTAQRAHDQLYGLAKDIETSEKTITVQGFERMEHWAQQVGQQLGIKLEL
jgi:hypothetical protein